MCTVLSVERLPLHLNLSKKSMKKKLISGISSLEYITFGDFTESFFSGVQGNAQSIQTYLQTHFSSHLTFCLLKCTLLVSSWLCKVANNFGSGTGGGGDNDNRNGCGQWL